MMTTGRKHHRPAPATTKSKDDDDEHVNVEHAPSKHSSDHRDSGSNRPDNTAATTTIITAQEFASAINGSDPTLASHALKKFAKTIQRQRRLAFRSPHPVGSSGRDEGGEHHAATMMMSDDDDDAFLDEEEEDDDEEEEDPFAPPDEQQPKKKKRRATGTGGAKDAWKDDTANYGVPFVGTSSFAVALPLLGGSGGIGGGGGGGGAGGATAAGGAESVERGTWPTGLLKSYLEASPRAVELTQPPGGGGGDPHRSSSGAGAARGGGAAGGGIGGGNPLVPPGGSFHRTLLRRGSSSGFGSSSSSKKNKEGQRKSDALYVSYLRALSELLSASVPRDVLKRDLRWTTTNRHGRSFVADGGGGGEGEGGDDGSGAASSQQQQQQQRYEDLTSIVARSHLRPLLHLVHERCSFAASASTAYDGSTHRLVAGAALDVLCRLSSASVGSVREVCRNIESDWSTDGLLRGAFRTPRRRNKQRSAKPKKAMGAATKTGGGGGGGDTVKSTTLGEGKNKASSSSSYAASYATATGCFKLASIVLESTDVDSISMTSTHGRKDRKIPPGLLYVSFRSGLAGVVSEVDDGDDDENDDDDDELAEKPRGGGGAEERVRVAYLRAAERMIAAARTALLPPPLAPSSSPPSAQSASEAEHGVSRLRRRRADVSFPLGERASADLLGGEALDRLLTLSLRAPTPSDGSFRSILECREEHDAKLTPVHLVAVEARRLLFLLLADPDRSPFLTYLLHPKRGGEYDRSEDTASSYIQQLSRALNGLTPVGGAGGGDSFLRGFVVHCVCTTPMLLPALFRSIAVPEPRPSFRCLASFAFVSRLAREGPPLQACIWGPRRGKIPLPRGDRILAYVLPSSLTKNLLGKAVRSSSALLATETLKLLAAVLGRARSLMTNEDEGDTVFFAGVGDKDRYRSSIAEALQRRLPDIQSLLSIRSRFDPFVGSGGGGEGLSSDVNAVVTLHLCEVLQLYSEVLPEVLRGVKFDWAKLFPEDGRAFLGALPILQCRLLRTLETLTRGVLNSNRFSSKLLSSLLVISTTSPVPKVYEVARKLAITLIFRCISRGVLQPEAHDCLGYEASLWVDGVTWGASRELSLLLDTSEKFTVQHKVTCAQAWARTGNMTQLSELCFSSLLSTALATLASSVDTLSTDFSMLICQVTSKLLLYQANPRPLAALVLFCLGQGGTDHGSAKMLMKYAEAVLNSNTRSTVLFDSVLPRLISRSSIHLNIFQHGFRSVEKQPKLIPAVPGLEEIAAACKSHGASVLVRQCLRHLEESDQRLRPLQGQGILHEMLRCSVMIGLQGADEETRDSTIKALFRGLWYNKQNHSPELECLVLLALSCPSVRNDDVLQRQKMLLKYIRDCSSFCQRSFEACDTTKGICVSREGRLCMISIIAHCPLVPAKYMMPVMAALLQYCAKQDSSAHARYTKNVYIGLLFNMMQDSSELQKDSYVTFPFDSAFTLWTLLAGENGDDLSSRLCLCLERAMSMALMNSDSQNVSSSTVFLRFVEFSPETVTDLCISTFSSHVDPSILFMNDRRERQCDASLERRGDWQSAKARLFCSLLRYDALPFGPCLLQKIACLENDASFKRLWEGGAVDETVSVLLLQLQTQKHCTDIIQSLTYARAADVISLRALHLIEEGLNNTKRPQHKTLERAIGLVRLLVAQGYAEENSLKVFSSAFTSFIRTSPRPNDEKIEKLMLQESIALIMTHEEQQRAKADIAPKRCIGWSKLYSLVFVRLCTSLPKSLRTLQKGRGTSDVEQSCHTDTRSALSSLLDLMRITTEFDKEIVLENSRTIQNCIVACLKYGITNEDCESDGPSWIWGACIKLVRVILVKTMAPSANPIPLTDQITTSQVHSMVQSHSKFRVAMSGSTLEKTIDGNKENGSLSFKNDARTVSAAKLEIIWLLTCCISLDPSSINIDAETWSTMLEAYNAGTSEVDRSLRRLMYLYEKSMGDKGMELCKMDALCWGTPKAIVLSCVNQTTPGLSHGANWEWFIEALDLSRVRITITQFPLQETLVPNPDFSVEAWKEDGRVSFDEGLAEMTDNDSTCSNEGLLSSSGRQDEDLAAGQEARKSKHEVNHARQAFDEWHGDGPDDRYSPAFVLPIILGVLEAFFPPGGTRKVSKSTSQDDEFRGSYHADEHKRQRRHLDYSSEAKGGLDSANSSTNERDETIVAQHETFVNVAHRLCGKGGISLALASLSSRCPSLRQVAVATLRFFLLALQTQEACDLRTWRERPQLEMLLNSVQRGLTVRRAIQLARECKTELIKGGGGPPQQALLIPMMPAVSAVFLARAALILSKPADEMYGPMNRFFLRLDEHRGAYQDCFGLPAFISLFCSSSDDTAQARKERLWALHLLKDGSVDGYSYQVMDRRHAPALIMTTFDTFASRGGDNVEGSAILDVMCHMLKCGGVRAAHHMIGRIGLLPWLRGIVDGRDIANALPTIALRGRILGLVLLGLQAASQLEMEQPDMNICAEAVSLSRSCVVNMLVQAELEAKVDQDEQLNQFVCTLCEVLWTCRSIVVDSKHDAAFLLHHRGIPIKSALVLLEVVGNTRTELMAKTVDSLCTLPLQIEHNDLDSANHFCVSMLTQIHGADGGMLIGALKTVSLLCNSVSGLRGDKEIISILLTWRRKSLFSLGGLEAWLSCMSSLLPAEDLSEGVATVEVIGTQFLELAGKGSFAEPG